MGDNSHKVLMRYEMQLFLSGPESRFTSGPLAAGRKSDQPLKSA